MILIPLPMSIPLFAVATFRVHHHSPLPITNQQLYHNSSTTATQQIIPSGDNITISYHSILLKCRAQSPVYM